MRIALLTDGLFPYRVGGMQRYSAHLAEALVEKGVELSLFHTVRNKNFSKASAISLDGFKRDFRERVNNQFLEYPPTGHLPGHYLRDSQEYSEQLLRKFCASCPTVDFIYAQGQTGLAFVNAKKRGIKFPPIGVNIHGFEMFQPTADFISFVAKHMVRSRFTKILNGADFVFTFPGKIREIAAKELGIEETRIVVTRNGIPRSWILGKSSGRDEKTRFLFIGRVERRKGLPELIKAISMISRPDVEFHFVGPSKNEIKDIDSRIHCHGAINDSNTLQSILDCCDVLISSSFAEGMPTTILEAMSRGLAIIATDVGATSCMVDDENGLLISSPKPALLKDAIEALAGLSDEQLLLKKEISLSRINSFSWDEIAKDLIANIAGILRNT